ncbi:hypothetical protein [Lentzea sp. CC55]|uniref:hypothetical protein n=1 Tax=Lentzea sp. CC55 TaxID=2884909 RepID=UPI001F1F131D|nr:hypothetical protein [Lentzea sp. CC55]MCG8925413.1 hypothetical protein [Lentzea sp. CC55]
MRLLTDRAGQARGTRTAAERHRSLSAGEQRAFRCVSQWAASGSTACYRFDQPEPVRLHGGERSADVVRHGAIPAAHH